MKMKKIISILITACVTVAIIGSSFAGSKNDAKKGSGSKDSVPSFPVQLVPETPVSRDALDNYLKNGGVLHSEKRPAGGTISVQYNSGIHENMARQALNILKNDKGSTIYNKLNYDMFYDPEFGYTREFMTDVYLYAWYADEIESDGWKPYVGHFYGVGGKNYIGDTSPTAYSRFNNHYYNAYTSYNKGDKKVAAKELGMAIHYLEDLNAPHHANNSVAYATNHTSYESWVDSTMSNYWVKNATSSTYTYMMSTSFQTIANDFSASARATYANCSNSNFKTLAVNDTKSNTARAQRAIAGLYYKLLKDTKRV